MKTNLLVYANALRSKGSRNLGVGGLSELRHLAKAMNTAGLKGDIYDLPNGIRARDIASPFSLTNGFALNPDELCIDDIPELMFESAASALYEEVLASFRQTVNTPVRLDYALARTVTPLILKACYDVFLKRDDGERRVAFDSFKRIASYWIDEFALYEVYKALGVDLNDRRYALIESDWVGEFCELNMYQILYHQYVQFLLYEQRNKLLKDFEALGVGLIVNVPFGVDPNSADVYFHSNVFDDSLQIGCSPEPENGFPEQLWGMAAYRERTPELREYIKQKMRWIALFGSGVFLDHMVGWSGQYVIDAGERGDPLKVYGRFLTTDTAQRKENIKWFMDIVLEERLSIRGEVFGDLGRLEATIYAMNEYAERGDDVSVMRIPWKRFPGQALPELNSYRKDDLIAYGTHDIETPLQFLCNRKGPEEVGYSVEHRLAYLQEVLGISMTYSDLLLESENMTSGFAAELMRRMTAGTQSCQVLVTLNGFLSLLSSEYRNCSTRFNINVKPGTSGEVGNVNGNWSYYSPELETLTEDRDVKEYVRKFGKRTYRPFSGLKKLDVKPSIESVRIDAIGGKAENKVLLYKRQDRVWDVFDCHDPEDTVAAEICVVNQGNTPVDCIVRLDYVLEGISATWLRFVEVSGARPVGRRLLEEVKSEGLSLRLCAGERAHFAISTEEA